MTLTLRDVLSIQPLEVRNRELLAGPFRGVSTDTRTLEPGDLFVALRGPNFDGHRFIAEAVRRGAAGVLVEASGAKNLPAAPAIVVENSTAGLGLLARAYRRKFSLPILAIGGSSGKTTTKELCAAVLGKRYRVLATEKNFNNQVGVPMTLFRLAKGDEVAVVEIGTNHPGELEHLCMVLEPTHALLTNIGAEHLEFFGSVDGVEKEEGVLFAHCAKSGGTALVNADDARVVRAARGVRKSVAYGFRSRNASVRGRRLRLDPQARARFEFVGGRVKKPVPVSLNIPGRHHGFNALAAAAAGIAFGIPPRRIAEALEESAASDKRMSVMMIGGVTVLNDTYNANPDSTIAALETLGAMEVAGKKIAVLADMLELGDAAAAEHRRVGEAASRLGIGFLLAFGPLARGIVDAVTGSFAVHYDQKNALAEVLAELVAPGDAVLLKGSRGMAMETLVPFLIERLRASELERR